MSVTMQPVFADGQNIYIFVKMNTVLSMGNRIKIWTFGIASFAIVYIRAQLWQVRMPSENNRQTSYN